MVLAQPVPSTPMSSWSRLLPWARKAGSTDAAQLPQAQQKGGAEQDVRLERGQDDTDGWEASDHLEDDEVLTQYSSELSFAELIQRHEDWVDELDHADTPMTPAQASALDALRAFTQFQSSAQNILRKRKTVRRLHLDALLGHEPAEPEPESEPSDIAKRVVFGKLPRYTIQAPRAQVSIQEDASVLDDALLRLEHLFALVAPGMVSHTELLRLSRLLVHPGEEAEHDDAAEATENGHEQSAERGGAAKGMVSSERETSDDENDPHAILEQERTELTREWRCIDRDMHMSQMLASWTQARLSRRACVEAYRLLTDAVVKATAELIHAKHVAAHGRAPAAAAAPRSAANRMVRTNPAPQQQAVKRLKVWPNALEARRAVLHAALAAKYGSIEQVPSAVMMAGAPVVLFVRDACCGTSQGHFGDSVVSAEKCLLEFVDYEPAQFLAGVQSEREVASADLLLWQWQSVCLGAALVKVVDVAKAEQVRLLIGTIVKNEVLEAGFAPVLIVLHAPAHSQLLQPAALDALAALGTALRVRLHIESDCVPLLAHGEVPRNVQQVCDTAHSLILEPSKWFGFEAPCASLTYMQPERWNADVDDEDVDSGDEDDNSIEEEASMGEPGLGDDREGMRDGSGSDHEGDSDEGSERNMVSRKAKSSRARKRPLGTFRTEGELAITTVLQEGSLHAVVALWLLMTRLGTLRMRKLVEDCVVATSRVLEHLYLSPSLEVRVAGCGALLISHRMSQVDKAMRKYKARDRLAWVNRALLRLCTAQDAARYLCLGLLTQGVPSSSAASGSDSSTSLPSGDEQLILFSVPRILALNKLSVPEQTDAERFGDLLSSLSRDYEIALVSGQAFSRKMLRARTDLHLLDAQLAKSINAVVSFAVLRLVPEELESEQGEGDEGNDITFGREHGEEPEFDRASELVDVQLVFGDVIERVLAERKEEELARNRSASDGEGWFDVEVDEAAQCVLLYASAGTESVHAVRMAEMAAKIVATACEQATSEWRTQRLQQDHEDEELYENDQEEEEDPVAEAAILSEKSRQVKILMQRGVAPTVVSKPVGTGSALASTVHDSKAEEEEEEEEEEAVDDESEEDEEEEEEERVESAAVSVRAEGREMREMAGEKGEVTDLPFAARGSIEGNDNEEPVDGQYVSTEPAPSRKGKKSSSRGKSGSGSSSKKSTRRSKHKESSEDEEDSSGDDGGEDEDDSHDDDHDDDDDVSDEDEDEEEEDDEDEESSTESESKSHSESEEEQKPSKKSKGKSAEALETKNKSKSDRSAAASKKPETGGRGSARRTLASPSDRREASSKGPTSGGRSSSGGAPADNTVAATAGLFGMLWGGTDSSAKNPAVADKVRNKDRSASSAARASKKGGESSSLEESSSSVSEEEQKPRGKGSSASAARGLKHSKKDEKKRRDSVTTTPSGSSEDEDQDASGASDSGDSASASEAESGSESSVSEKEAPRRVPANRKGGSARPAATRSKALDAGAKKKTKAHVAPSESESESDSESEGDGSSFDGSSEDEEETRSPPVAKSKSKSSSKPAVESRSSKKVAAVPSASSRKSSGKRR
ncbi:hypothetical protein FVE85_2349 [Porphyridium purpureum]|uniref:Uncharacterized protein n=1 Tax=Porphyridium purpureum TaxID=35688 RepID=A0A5J4YZL0_PORPP|nr:hypothetical protein FVE85_2349 [Porphyridium purpureum]|eukprot:POR6995..scf209_3